MEKEEVLKIIKTENVKFLKLMFVDLLGELKTVEIPVHCLDNALANKIMVDGSSLKGISSVNESDVFLRPDINSFRVLPLLNEQSTKQQSMLPNQDQKKPFGGGEVAIFMCDVLGVSGEELPNCTRSNLKRNLKELKEHGFTTLNIGFEPEFFLFKNKPTSIIKPTDFVDTGKYCADECTDDGAIIRREILYELERIGISCQCAHHERSTSQHEITYRFSDAVTACDTLILVKFLIKTIAKKHGYTATFMPKPVQNINGSGLHTNISLATSTNPNAFADKKEPLSKIAGSFLAGVLRHAPALCFLTNPTINSYKRLVAGYEAPVNICWSASNRSAMIRVPATGGGSSARIELRSPDAGCNPYLAISAILSAGLDGIKNAAEAPEPVALNIYDLTEQDKKRLKLKMLPTCLTEALVEFKKDATIMNSFSPLITENLIELKIAEIENYKTQVSEFDITHYYNI